MQNINYKCRLFFIARTILEKRLRNQLLVSLIVDCCWSIKHQTDCNEKIGVGDNDTVNDTHKLGDVRLKTCTHIFRACFSTNFDLYIIEYLRHVVLQFPRPSIN